MSGMAIITLRHVDVHRRRIVGSGGHRDDATKPVRAWHGRATVSRPCGVRRVRPRAVTATIERDARIPEEAHHGPASPAQHPLPAGADPYPDAADPVLGTLLIYFVGAEQGATSLISGHYVHEFVHDARHLLGFPCH